MNSVDPDAFAQSGSTNATMNELTFEQLKAVNPHESDVWVEFHLDQARDLYEGGAEENLHLPPKEYPLVPALPGLGRTWSGEAFDQPRFLSLAEVCKIYNATAFAMTHLGIAFNLHLTIVWRGLSVYKHRQANQILARFNKAAAAWLGVGSDVETRQRFTRRALRGGSPHAYVYVHEYGLRQGFHTHQLMFVPFEKAAAFEQWAKRRLTELAGRRRAESYAIYLSPRNLQGFRPPQFVKDRAASTTWSWFRYIIKSLHPAFAFRGENGKPVFACDVLKPWPYEEMQPIYTRRVAGFSENIGPKAQAAAGFDSRLDRSDDAHLYDGDELKIYRERKEQERRAEELREVLNSLKI